MQFSMRPEDIATVTAASGQRLFLLSSLVLAGALGCLIILTPFLAAIAWAAILAYTSWPLYKKIRRPFGRHESAAAFTMTLLLTCAVVLPILWVAALAGGEIVVAYRAASNFLAQKPHALPAFIRDIPWLAAQVQQQIERFSAEPAALGGEFIKWMQSLAGQLTAFMSGIGRNLGKLLVAMVTVYFLYRDGDSIVLQCHWVAKRFFADRIDPYLKTIAQMTRAVVYGLVLTAIAQGLIAGIGYAIVGIEAAALLGALTGILSVVPVLGTGAVWGSLGVYLLMTGHLLKGIFLLIWGTVLVHPTDNVLRPLLISNATDVPFLVVMFGVIGGLTAFGLVGAFLGPIILATGLAAWREWAAPNPPVR